jgi:uroporphyrin-III C-methyltransferase
MNAESTPPSAVTPGTAPPAADAVAVIDLPESVIQGRPAMGRGMLVLGVIALLALLLSALMWQKLSSIQEQLARQSADSGATAVEARTLAKQAQEQVQETAARQSVMQARLSEVALQRSQLEELMQSLSRSRDENLVVDIDSSIRLAQQQAQLTGSVEPLLAALKTAEQRVMRAAQPRLNALQNAIARDVGRIKGTTVSDTPALLVKLDELVRLADDLPLANAVAKVAASGSLKPQRDDSVVSWWQRSLAVVLDEMRNLVRLSRIEHPEAALLSPDQSFFVRENFKLRLLNARLGLLARQLDAARSDLAGVAAALHTYFDPSSRKTQVAAELLRQLQGQMKTLDLPRVDDTLAALNTAAAGR